MGTYCAMHGCFSAAKNKERSFFRFPRDEDRCRRWVIVSGRSDLINKDARQLNRSYYLCDLHFRKSDRVVKKLKQNAVPTQNLPEDYLSRTKSTQYEYSTPQRVFTQEIGTQTATSSFSDSSTQTTIDLPSNSPPYEAEAATKMPGMLQMNNTISQHYSNKVKPEDINIKQELDPQLYVELEDAHMKLLFKTEETDVKDSVIKEIVHIKQEADQDYNVTEQLTDPHISICIKEETIDKS